MLTHSLELSADPGQAAEFAAEPFNVSHGPFGNLSSSLIETTHNGHQRRFTDIGLKIRSTDGRILCCNEYTRTVALLTDDQADERGEQLTL